MKKLLLVILSVCILSLSLGVLTACSKKNVEVSEGEFKDALIIGTTTEIKSLNRLDADSGAPGYNFDVLCGTLAFLAPVTMIGTDYADGLCSYANDGKVWTFRVIDGMKWHDGYAVTADDLEYTFNQFFNVGQESSAVSSVTKKDDKTVEVTLKTINPRFLSNVVVMRVMPKRLFEGKTKDTLSEADSVIGNGPFKFVKWDKNAGTLKFEKFDGYPYAEDVYINTVYFKLFGSADTMNLALKTEDIDMIYKYAGGIDSAAEADFATRANLKLTTVNDASNPLNLIFNNSVVTDKRIREAISKAIDYGKIRELFGTSASRYSESGFVSPGNYGYIPTTELARDLEGAKAILKSLGYGSSNKYDFKLLCQTSSIYPEVAKVLKTQLEETGLITVTVNTQDSAIFRQAIAEHTHQACLAKLTAFGMSNKGGLGSMYFDPEGTLSYGYVPTVSGSEQTAFGKVLSALKQATAETEYKAAAKAYQEYFASEYPAISLLNDAYAQVYNAKISGFVKDGTFGLLNVNTWINLRYAK